MKKFTLFIVALFFLQTLTAQSHSQSATVSLQLTASETSLKTAILEVPLAHDGPFLTYYVRSSEQVSDILIRFSIDGESWENWQMMEPESHQTFDDGTWISEMAFLENKELYFQVSAIANYANLNIFFYNPGHTPEIDERLTVRPQGNRSCPCPQPDFLTRLQWCPAGDCYPHPNPSGTVPTHLIIHHSASSNSASDWAAVVRSFWDFHVNGNGWSDIGYNWLIDPNGIVYEGRGDNILGAHFCGTNGGTVGTCVIGNFTNALPTETAVDKLVDLYAWKACNRNLDPLGVGYHNSSEQTLNRISGHRDGCSTACPGDMFYPILPTVRARIAERILGACSGLAGVTGLQGSFTGDTEITLNWDDNSDEELGFLIERKEAGDFAYHATAAADMIEYIDNGVQLDVIYTYRMRTFTASDTSDYSNELVLDSTVGTADVHFNEQTVQLYPNPVRDVLQINLDNALSGLINIEIFNPVAKEVQQSYSFEKNTTKATFELTVEDIPSCIYLLRVSQDGYSGVFKIVVQ